MRLELKFRGPGGRESAALVAALVLHAALLFAPSRERAPALEADWSTPVEALDIEIEAPGPSLTAEKGGELDKAGSPEPRAPSRPGAVAAKVALPRGSVVESPEPPAPEAPAGENPPSPGLPTDEYGGPPEAGTGTGVVGLPPGIGTPIWSLPGVMPSAPRPAPAPTVATGPRPVPRDIASKVLSGSLHSRDKGLGLEVPAAGLVASTLAAAVRSSAAPLDARATFEVRLSGSGKVESVRLVSATAGQGPTWDGVAAAAKSSLAGRALDVGNAKKPVTVRVKVESKVQYPAGSKKKAEAQVVCLNEELERLANGAINGGGFDLSRQATTPGVMNPPTELDEEKRKFCIPAPAIKVKGDLSNIGAHRINVVSSSFTVVRDGERALPHAAPLPIDTRAPWAPDDPTKVRKPKPPRKKKKKKKKP